ncbi:MAG: hypothetical protein HY763_01345 [Planctomycetes bacterium]|nr:hypothetical protein [Planctomycetota bacterium]
MSKYLRNPGLAAVLFTLVAWMGCTPGGGGTGGGGGGQTGGTTDQPSAGEALFRAQDCSACHNSQTNNFGASTADDIVDTLLGDLPHAGGALGPFTEDEIDDLTEFLVAVMTGDDDLDEDDDGGAGDDDGDDDGGDGDDDDDDGSGNDTPAHAWFEQVWSDFDRHYSHFGGKGVDWSDWRDTYEPQFREDLSDAEFLARLAPALEDLRDIHVWLFDAAGAAVEVYSRPAAQNYPDSYQSRYFSQGVTQLGSYPLYHALLDGDIAYISIESFEGTQWDGLRTGELDTLFAGYRDAVGLVIDVRSNNGGNETVAAAIAGHLTEAAFVYGYHRDRNPGTDHDDFADFQSHELQPADNERFLGPTACLIGERNLSSAEWFVLMMRENPRGITLIGDTTRGSSGNPSEFALDSGIKYYIPRWIAFRADQVTEVEDVGIPPTQGFAIAPEDSYTADQDLVLERALELLGS